MGVGCVPVCVDSVPLDYCEGSGEWRTQRFGECKGEQSPFRVSPGGDLWRSVKISASTLWVATARNPPRCTPVREGWGGRCRVAAGRGDTQRFRECKGEQSPFRVSPGGDLWRSPRALLWVATAGNPRLKARSWGASKCAIRHVGPAMTVV